MADGADVSEARAWLYERLSTGATATALAAYHGAGAVNQIYRRRTPMTPSYPLVRIEVNAVGYETGVGGAGLWSSAGMVVKAVGRDASDAQMGALAAAIKQDLHGARGIMAGTTFTCVAASALSYDEIGPINETYLHEGWILDLTVET